MLEIYRLEEEWMKADAGRLLGPESDEETLWTLI